MEIASLIVGIICMILLIVLIFRKGGTGGDEGFSSEELEALAEQMDTLRKEHREGQSELRRELNTMLNDAMRTLNDQTQSNQRHWAGEQSRQLSTLFAAQKEQLHTIGTAQSQQLKATQQAVSRSLEDMGRNLTEHLQQLEQRFATLESNMETKLEGIRNSMEEQLKSIREDNTRQLDNVRKTVDEKLQTNNTALTVNVTSSIQQLEQRFATLEKNLDTRLQNVRDTVDAQLKAIREDNTQQLDSVRKTVDEKLQSNMTALNTSVRGSMQQLEQRFATLEKNMETKLQNVRDTVDTQLKGIRDDNTRQLDQIRGTVDEKLQKTLESKMNESFKLVSDRLEEVYKGLGEMQNVAKGVGDLKKVLTNVKTRGILGEIQLGAILKEMLTPDQYDENVATVPKSANRVEFAVKLPGAEDGKIIYLPIDSKFNGDRFTHLQDAYDIADPALITAAKKELADAIRKCAKDISDKYISPPYTTQFAIMFLPFEGLYAEVVNTAGLVEELQRSYKVTVAGPSTMAAMLNSLRMGFQTLAIQKRSSEVWEVLGAVKTEFENFEKALTDTQDKLRKTEDSLEKLVGVRTRQMNRRLNRIEKLDPQTSLRILNE